MFKHTVDNAVKDTCETLDLQVSYTHAGNSRECIYIGVLESNATGKQGTISLEIIHHHLDGIHLKHLQLYLTEEEIGMLIGGLQRARKGMRRLKMARI